MRRQAPNLAAFLIGIGLLAAGTGQVAAQSEVTTYTPERLQWSQLVYKASKMGVKVESEAKISIVPAAEAGKSLIAADGGQAVEVSGDGVARIQIDNSVKGTDSVSVLLLDPQTGGAYQRSQVFKSKKKNFLRTYRYLTEGVFIERRLPSGAATGSPWDWPVNNTRTLPFPQGVAGHNVTEGMALFYILTAADFNEVGDTLRFYNFDRDGMSEVLMTVEELMPRKVDYIEVSGDSERRVKGSRQVARLTISGRSVGEGEDSFEFLGLRGKIEIFADPELRIPIAVKGKIPVAGKSTIEVKKVVLK